VRGSRGADVHEIVEAALPAAMRILGSADGDQARAILEDLVEEALKGPEHAKLPDLPPGASPDEVAALAEAEGAQAAALLAQADLMRRVLAEAKQTRVEFLRLESIRPTTTTSHPRVTTPAFHLQNIGPTATSRSGVRLQSTDLHDWDVSNGRRAGLQGSPREGPEPGRKRAFQR
jgi:hypothetical protein